MDGAGSGMAAPCFSERTRPLPGAQLTTGCSTRALGWAASEPEMGVLQRGAEVAQLGLGARRHRPADGQRVLVDLEGPVEPLLWARQGNTRQHAALPHGV